MELLVPLTGPGERAGRGGDEQERSEGGISKFLNGWLNSFAAAWKKSELVTQLQRPDHIWLILAANKQ